MIQLQTILKVTDNSGAKTVKCIKILGGFKKKFSFIGNVIVVSVQKLRNKSKITSKVKKGEIYKALIVRTKKRNVKKDGSSLFFDQNSVSLLNKQGRPLASRVVGPVPKGLVSKFLNISIGIV